jgi:hypothetical protein
MLNDASLLPCNGCAVAEGSCAVNDAERLSYSASSHMIANDSLGKTSYKGL